MEKKRFMNIWEGLYPFLIFYSIVQLLVIGGLGIFSKQNSMIIQNSIQTIMLLPMFFWIRKNKIIDGDRVKIPWNIPAVICILLSSALFSMSLNQIIDASQIKSLSDGYQIVSNALYKPGHFQILFFVGLLAPIFEEVLYRGILFGAFRKKFSFTASAIISAALFGALHMNFVQFIYAASMGYIFAFFYEKTKKLGVPVLAHIFANVTSLCMTWTGASAWIFSRPMLSLALAAVEGILAIVLLLILKKLLNHTQSEKVSKNEN